MYANLDGVARFGLEMKQSNGLHKSNPVFLSENWLHTVDGRNPAPPGMYKTLYIMG